MLLDKMLGTHKFILENNMKLGKSNEGKMETGKY